MAVRLEDIAMTERERVEPYVRRLQEYIQRRDPKARFSLQVSNVPEYWELNAYVDSSLAEDPDFGEELAKIETDLLLDFDVAICTIPIARQNRSRLWRTAKEAQQHLR
jgi:hypothetical protein